MERLQIDEWNNLPQVLITEEDVPILENLSDIFEHEVKVATGPTGLDEDGDVYEVSTFHQDEIDVHENLINMIMEGKLDDMVERLAFDLGRAVKKSGKDLLWIHSIVMTPKPRLRGVFSQ